jgi:hypothetical protein
MSTQKSKEPETTFKVYRRLVLRELENHKVYPHFKGTVTAFQRAGGLDQFSKDLFPMLKSCWELNYPVSQTARKLDDLTSMINMRAALYAVEAKTGNEGQDV